MLAKNLILLAVITLLIGSSYTKDDCKERISKTCEETVWNQCYYDPDRGCFKHFPTNCDMEIAACKHNQDYISWPSKYCDSVQFLCQEEVEDYDWGPEDFYEQIRHIRDNVKNQFEIMLEQKDQANV